MSRSTYKNSNIPTAPKSSILYHSPASTAVPHRQPLCDVGNIEAHRPSHVKLRTGNSKRQASHRLQGRPQSSALKLENSSQGRLVRPVANHLLASLARRSSRTAGPSSPSLIPTTTLRSSARATSPRQLDYVVETTPGPLAFTLLNVQALIPSLGRYQNALNRSGPAHAAHRGHLLTSQSEKLQAASSTPEDSKVLSDNAFKVAPDDNYDALDDIDNLFLNKVRSALSRAPFPPLMPHLRDGSVSHRPVVCQAPPQLDGLVVAPIRVSSLSFPASGPMEEDEEPEGLWYYFLSRESVMEDRPEPVSESPSLVKDSLAETFKNAVETTPRLWEISSDEYESSEDEDDDTAPAGRLITAPRPTSVIVVLDTEKTTQSLSPPNAKHETNTTSILSSCCSSGVSGSSVTKRGVGSLMRPANNVKAMMPLPRPSDGNKNVAPSNILRLPTSRIPGYRRSKPHTQCQELSSFRNQPLSRSLPQSRPSVTSAFDTTPRNPSGSAYPPHWSYSKYPIDPRSRAMQPPSVQRWPQLGVSAPSQVPVYPAQRRSLVLNSPAVFNPHPARLNNKKLRRNGMAFVARPEVCS